MGRAKVERVRKQYVNPEGGPVTAGVDDSQQTLFGQNEDFHRYWQEWQGMPEFVQGDLEPNSAIIVNFAAPEDRKAFASLVDQKLTPYTRSIWYPKAVEAAMMDKRWRSWSLRPPRHPVYIVSKGRWDTKRRLTDRVLDRMGVPHFIVVEESEVELYRHHATRSATVIVLDPAYQRDYDACDDLGMTKGKGPGPARNFAWDHAISSGARWHWVMDDNITYFYRFNRNLHIPVVDGTPFTVMEDFAARYGNVTMVGPNYFMFVPRKQRVPPYVLNTRIYSCNLIRNAAPYRWRGRYNEDTDISLRMLKDGWVTVQYNAFTQHKLPTQTVEGGNTEEFYAQEGTKPKSEMLRRLHPDVTEVVWKWGRWHHQVDYKPFRVNQLRFREGLERPAGTDEYGLVLERRDEYGNWVPELSRRWDNEMPLGDLQIGMGM